MKVSFDQYQRYKNMQKIVQKLRMNQEKFSILEVGANFHKNLEQFLPEDTIKYLDIELPDEFKNDPTYIIGDATNLSGTKDNSYDVTVALDVLEHIPAEKREAFFTELFRVSTKMVIVSAPFASPKINGAEKRLNEFYKSLHAQDFIWLKEHLTNGLPTLDNTLKFLDFAKISHFAFPHGNLDIWEKMMRLHFLVAANASLHEYRFLLDEYYNSEIFDHDYCTNAYRHFIICVKEASSLANLQDSFKTVSNLPSWILKKFCDLESSIPAALTVQNYQVAHSINGRTGAIQNTLDTIPEKLESLNSTINDFRENYKIEFIQKAELIENLQSKVEDLEKQHVELISQNTKLREYLLINHVDPDTGIDMDDFSIRKIILRILRKLIPNKIKRLIRKFWIFFN